MKLELHSHSWYSKGRILKEENIVSPVEMVKEARRKGLNGIAITDHDSLKSWDSLKRMKFDNFIIIPGEEISTRQGHLIALGIAEVIKPGQEVLETIDKIHQQGGIAIAPHPFDIGKKGIRNFSRFADAIEVFNAMNLDRFANLRTLKYAKKFKKPMVAGSDAHLKEWIGRGSVEINSDYNLDSVLKEIKKGNTKLKKDYITLGEMTDWYLNRLNRNYASAVNHADSNYWFLKRVATKTLMKFSGRKSAFSRGLVFSLSHLTFAGSIVYSFYNRMYII